MLIEKDHNIVVHTVHIPVLGIGYSIDTPIKVAKYGISSVISLVNDSFIEQVRKFYWDNKDGSYEKIPNNEPDHRALRITSYLDLVARIVKKQFEELISLPFEQGNDISKYFEMLPESVMRQEYIDMLDTKDAVAKKSLQERLIAKMVPGHIDVNIMTTLDKENYHKGKKLPREYSDAMSSLRGFANSTLESSLVLSAGLNQRLYSYITEFDDFFPDIRGKIKKTIILKVSNYRSSLLQAKFLAKKGIWVSEHRIESGLNCGGHSFPTKGELMGPILEEFRFKRHELTDLIFPIYSKALKNRGIYVDNPPDIRITVQGGIGTPDEDRMLQEYYRLDGTGWGTPFLLVPEATNVDKMHIELLKSAEEKDVELSKASPLKVPYWNLLTSGSEKARLERIMDGKPGVVCTMKHLRLNTDFTEKPICPASREYQKLSMDAINKGEYNEKQREMLRKSTLSAACICKELCNSFLRKYDLTKKETSTVCCGPNIANFSNTYTLDEMIGYIYGKETGVKVKPGRKHMFAAEAVIYIDFLKETLKEFSLEISNYKQKYIQDFYNELVKGINYYKNTFAKTLNEKEKESFLDSINESQTRLNTLMERYDDILTG